MWPRATRPRVLPRDITTLLAKLPAALRSEVLHRVQSLPAVAPVDARILGRAYEKQVDVVIARWDRGPELMISTKAQLSSFGKNLPNRFEESYGDASNLRGRYPLAAVGYFFVQRATIRTAEPDAFERSIDMIRKLRDTGDTNGYTATALLLLDWDPTTGIVTAHPDLVPTDVAPDQFFIRLIDQVLTATPGVLPRHRPGTPRAPHHPHHRSRATHAVSTVPPRHHLHRPAVRDRPGQRGCADRDGRRFPQWQRRATMVSPVPGLPSSAEHPSFGSDQGLRGPTAQGSRVGRRPNQPGEQGAAGGREVCPPVGTPRVCGQTRRCPR